LVVVVQPGVVVVVIPLGQTALTLLQPQGALVLLALGVHGMALVGLVEFLL
jgi:hypothetical protein